MNLFVIAGFLGSGKTSLLMEIAKEISKNSDTKLAIIENEVGKIGVDDHLLKEEGLSVREIYSGCVCCSLRTSLIQTLLDLERNDDPDVVFLEPSGVASPKQVLNALNGYSGEIDRKQVVVVIDAERFNNLQDLSIPIIEDGINVADLIVLNKIDLVDEKEISILTERVQSLRPDVDIVAVSTLNGDNMNSLTERLSRHQTEPSSKPIVASLEQETTSSGPQPVVHADKIEWRLPTPMDSDTLIEEISEKMSVLCQSLKRVECLLIGHIKAIVKTDGSGYLMMSSTSFDQPPTRKGRLPRMIEKVELTLNAIVYDIEKIVLQDLIKKHFDFSQ